MTTLRQLIDGKTLFAAFPPTKPPAAKPPGFLDTAKPSAGTPSPAANHVASHLNDPFGQTKDDLDQLNQKKMEYEQLKNQMAMKLAPVESVTRGIRNMHEIDDPLANPYDVDPLQDPNNPNNGMTPSNLPPGQSAAPGTAPMSQMNNMRPSQTGFAPGKATGFSGQQVVPPKMGMPQPGQANSGTVAGNPSQPAGWGQQNNMAPQAPKPPGAGQLPGAKGPGDPKVAGPVKKAQNASNKAGTRPIKIQVHADRSASPAHTTLAQAAGVASLRSACKEDDEEAMACCDEEYPVGSKRYATKKVTARKGR